MSSPMTTVRSKRKLFDALMAVRTHFGPVHRHRKLHLLECLAARPPTGPRGLPEYRDALLFLAAYPDDPAVRRAAEAGLRGVGEVVAGNRRLAERLGDTGIAGTIIEAPFSIDLIQWLGDRFPGDVEIAWQDESAGPALDDLLAVCALPSERDGLLSEKLSTQAWLGLASGGPGTGLAWVLQRLGERAAVRELADHVFESLELAIRWRLRPQAADRRFARPRVFYQKETPARGIDQPAFVRLIDRRLPETRPLSGRRAAQVIEIARLTLAARRRETDPITYAHEREVTLFGLERGLDIAVFGLRPNRRLPLESFFGYLAARNGVPVAYGGGWVLLDRCEIGINIFEQFRGGESALLFGQVLRLYRQHYNVRRFLVDPFQFGADNRDGIRSGAFWFYYRFGFRPVDPALAAVAEREWTSIRADRSYRTPARTLRRFATVKVALDVEPPPHDRNDAPDVVEIGLAVTRAVGERFGGDAAAAGRWATGRVDRMLDTGNVRDWPATERAAYERLAPVVALFDGLDSWPATDRRALTALMRAKGGHRERDFVRKVQAHRRFGEGLARLGGG